MTNDFRLQTQLLSESNPHWGEVALIPWDTEIFKFRVGMFSPGEATRTYAERHSFAATLEDWATQENIELVSCHVPLETSNVEELAGWRWILARSGWVVVEQAMTVALSDLQNYQTSDENLLRLARDEDQSAIERMASKAFRHGRYSADPKFPAASASLRYARWMTNAFESLRAGSETTQIYIIGSSDEVHGFMHVEVRGENADIRLNAIVTDIAPKGSGRKLYDGTLQLLREQGVQCVTAKIASENIPVVNLYAKLGFRFSSPEWVFHWHAPNAPHLLREP